MACDLRVLHAQGLFVPQERRDVKLVLDATDEWGPYVRAHMEAIRAKY